MFNYDWFHHGGLARLISEAKERCAAKKFPDQPRSGSGGGNGSPEFIGYRDALETRIILYMKDGLQYELKEMADVGTSTALAFECVPMDDSYKVGAIVIIAPFDDIARVEVYAVHPDERPPDSFRIPGFRAGAMEGRE